MTTQNNPNEASKPSEIKSMPCTWCDEDTYMTCPDCGGTRLVTFNTYLDRNGEEL